MPISSVSPRRLWAVFSWTTRAATTRRSQGVCKVTLDDEIAGVQQQDIDIMAVDEALTRLAQIRCAAEPHRGIAVFAGLSIEDTSEVLKLSPATVKRDWAMAKA